MVKPIHSWIDRIVGDNIWLKRLASILGLLGYLGLTLSAVVLGGRLHETTLLGWALRVCLLYLGFVSLSLHRHYESALSLPAKQRWILAGIGIFMLFSKVSFLVEGGFIAIFAAVLLTGKKDVDKGNVETHHSQPPFTTDGMLVMLPTTLADFQQLARRDGTAS